MKLTEYRSSCCAATVSGLSGCAGQHALSVELWALVLERTKKKWPEEGYYESGELVSAAMARLSAAACAQLFILSGASLDLML